MVALPMGNPIGKANSWPMWGAVNMSVEFLEVEQINLDLLPFEQITVVSWRALWWACKMWRKPRRQRELIVL